MIYDGFSPEQSKRVNQLILERNRLRDSVISIRKFAGFSFFLGLLVALTNTRELNSEDRYGGSFYADIIKWTIILMILTYTIYTGIAIANKTFYLRRRSDEDIFKQVKEEINEDPKRFWGVGIKWYTDEDLSKQASSARDIIDALGSKYPLDLGENPSQKLIEHAEENHYDGHLAVGGNLFWDGKGHMITVGGARLGGKGSCLILPALLGVPNRFPNAPSYIVLDPKGENLAVSGNYLKESGYDVICINPFAIPEIYLFGNGSFNVFDTFDADTPNFDDYADMIASALVSSSKNSNPHFDETSRSYISIYIRHMMTQDEEPKNFRTLYKWLRLGGEDRMNFLGKMALNMAFDGDIAGEAIAIGSQIRSGASDEIESTYSTIRGKTDVFKNKQLRESISDSTFDITQIANKKTAIFVCMNPTELQKNQAWIRILFGSFIRSLSVNYNKDRKVVMILDEFPTMGRVSEIEMMMGYMAGYNVTLWPIMQDLTQIKGLYPDSWETFVNNTVVKHFTAIGDNFTAAYVSKRMPIVNMGSEEKPRYEPLLRPDEIQAEKDIIAFISGAKKPAFMNKTPYWKNGATSGSASTNPFI